MILMDVNIWETVKNINSILKIDVVYEWTIRFWFQKHAIGEFMRRGVGQVSDESLKCLW